MAFLSLVVRFGPSSNGIWRCKWPIWAVFHFLPFLVKNPTFQPDHGLDMRDLVDLGPKSTSPRISDRPPHETYPKWVKMGFLWVFDHVGSIWAIFVAQSGSLFDPIFEVCHFWPFCARNPIFGPNHGLDMRISVDLGRFWTSSGMSDRPPLETCPKWVKMGFLGVFSHLGRFGSSPNVF